MSIDWTTAAVIAAVCIGLVNTIDSHLIARRMPGFRPFLIPVGILIALFAVIIGCLNPLPPGFSGWPLAAAVGSNVLRVCAITISLHTMRTEEVSRIIPVVQTSPIFVALMAVPLLGERLLWLDWLAIFIVVSGAVIISLRHGGGRLKLGTSFFKLIGASLLLAAADVSAKYALGYVDFWQMYWLTAAVMALTFLGIGLRRRFWRELVIMPQRNRTLAIVVANESVGVVGAIMLFTAISAGPVSLVSAINASRPLFVLVFSLIISLIVPSFTHWEPGRSAFMLRLAATVMIVGGIVTIYLT